VTIAAHHLRLLNHATDIRGGASAPIGQITGALKHSLSGGEVCALCATWGWGVGVPHVSLYTSSKAQLSRDKKTHYTFKGGMKDEILSPKPMQHGASSQGDDSRGAVSQPPRESLLSLNMDACLADRVFARLLFRDNKPWRATTFTRV
jgi:hypothetical protein